MQNKSAKIFSAFLVVALVSPACHAQRLESSKLIGEKLLSVPQQVAAALTLRLQHASLLDPARLEHFLQPSFVRRPFVSLFLELTPSQADHPRKDTLDGALIGFGLGSILSAGNAQQAVNQEGQKEELVKQQKARQESAANNGTDQEAEGRKSSTKASGESGKGTTASGPGRSRSAVPPAPVNW